MPLLDVWQEVARHRDVEEATERIARLVGARVSADLLVVRRLDVPSSRLETVALGACRGERPAERPRTELRPGQLEAVAAWCRGDEVVDTSAGAHRLAPLLVPSFGRGWALATPLRESDAVGLVALVYRGGGPGAGNEALLRGLREALGVALANDARLHEMARMREALEADRRALLQRLERQEVMDVVLGADGGLRGVLEQVEQVAPTDVPVLLLGETGTGKEVIARTIHARSRRSNGPVERVNCGAIPAGLVDSELFGHERGSFTGAHATRQGRFERADGGTLFLDEIGELPPEAQVRLLRILQDGVFERVGGTAPLHADVRIVAATHRDLESMVRRREFREDLWYRINVFPIRLPPLRERAGDIPAMAHHFAWRAGKRLAGTPLVPTAEDLDVLIGYGWPGNVRELAAVIERAAILGEGRRLDVSAALGTIRTEAAPASPERTDRLATLDEAQRSHIERALELSRGRIEGRHGAAARLGVNPHTLRSRMRRLGVEWARFREG